MTKTKEETEEVRKRMRARYIFECQNTHPTVMQIINKTIEEMNK